MRLPLIFFLLCLHRVFAQDSFESSSQYGASAALLKNAKMMGVAGKKDAATDLGRAVSDGAIIDSLYHIGPGDVFAIYLGEPRQFTVGPEGFLQLPDTPPVSLQGMDLRTAKKAVKSALRKGYDTSKVFVSLASAKNFRVHVLGAVVNPGVRTMMNFARVDEVITVAGGFSRNAVRDRILIVSASGDSSEVDLQAYFDSYQDGNNPYLNMGDKIVVRSVEKSGPVAVIRFNGETYFHQADGKYDLRQVFAQINSYANNELPGHLRVARANGKAADVEMAQALAFHPGAGDTVEFFKDAQNVFVGGAVLRPSAYVYVPQFTPQDYIFLAGILPNTQDPESYVVVRNGAVLPHSTVSATGVKPGDKIRIDRTRIESTRDYLSIIASLAGIMLSAATLYYTATRN